MTTPRAGFTWEGIPETVSHAELVRRVNASMRRLSSLLAGLVGRDGQLEPDRAALPNFRLLSISETHQRYQWNAVRPGDRVFATSVEESKPIRDDPWARVAPLTVELPSGTETYEVPFPAEGAMTFVQIEAYDRDLVVGQVEQHILYPRMSVPALDDDTGELAIESVNHWQQFASTYRPWLFIPEGDTRPEPSTEGRLAYMEVDGTRWRYEDETWVDVSDEAPAEAFAPIFIAGAIKTAFLAAEVAEFIDARAQEISDALAGAVSSVIRSDTPPATRADGSDLQVGDVWVETDNGDRPWTWTGSGWQRAYTLIDGGDLETGTVELNALAFTAVTADDVVASINASAEGLRILAARIIVDGTAQFATGYNPTSTAAVISAGSAPSTRADGSPLRTGDRWEHTGEGRAPYTWDGSAWQRAYTQIDGAHIITGTITALGAVNTGLLQNAAATPTAAIRIDPGSTLPPSATTYLDLAATTGAPILKTPLLEISNSTAPVALEPLRLVYSAFTLAASDGPHYATDPAYMRPKNAAETLAVRGSLRLAKGLQVTGLTARMYRETVGDVATATLYRTMEDGSVSALGTATHSSTGWVNVPLTLASTETVDEGVYHVYVELQGALVATNARLMWAQVEPEITNLFQLHSA